MGFLGIRSPEVPPGRRDLLKRHVVIRAERRRQLTQLTGEVGEFGRQVGPGIGHIVQFFEEPLRHRFQQRGGRIVTADRKLPKWRPSDLTTASPSGEAFRSTTNSARRQPIPNTVTHGPSFGLGSEKLRFQTDSPSAGSLPGRSACKNVLTASLLFVELAIELLLLALFVFPLLPRPAIQGKGEIVVHIAAVEVPEHGPRPIGRHLTQRTILVDDRLRVGSRHGDSLAFQADHLGRRPAAEVFPVRFAKPRLLDLAKPRSQFRGGLGCRPPGQRSTTRCQQLQTRCRTNS